MNASTPTVGEAQEKQQQRQTQTTARGAGFGGGGSGGPLSPTGAVLHKAARARVEAFSPLHAAALALHCLLVSEGFVCTGQDDKAGAIKGFAPPVRDVPEEKLVPDNWDADGAVVSFRYRLPATPGKVYLFKTTSSGKGGSTLFHLAQREGDMRTAGMDLAALDGSDQAYFENESFFEGFFATFRREILHYFLPERTDSPDPPLGRDMDECDPLRAGPPRFAGPPGVGPTPFVPRRGGDFGGDLFPSSGGIGGGGGGLPGPGGLLGPGHPMFGGGDGAGYMQPRFDPYGPSMPGQPWGPGVPGGPGRGGVGRGGPGRGSDRGPDGGPDNDHLPPPQGSDNMFF